MTRLPLLLFLASPAFAGPVTVAFSPSGGATEAVVAVIAEAHHSIHLAGYSFTSKPIAQALIDASRRGVEVDIVLDKSNATDRYSEAAELAGAGIPVKLDYRYAIMHDKFIIADGLTVETGSFNYTRAAEMRNAENVIVLRNEPDIAAQYQQTWTRLWNESEKLK